MPVSDLLQFIISGVTAGSIYAIIALGFTIIFNATDVMNFAQGEFVMLGGMLAWTLNAVVGIPLALSILIAVILVTLFGALVHYGLIRHRSRSDVMTLIIITVGVSMTTKASALLIWGKDPKLLQPFSGEVPINFFGATIIPQMLWVLGTSILVMLGMYLFFNKTMIGQAMLACSINKDAASLMGIPTQQIALISFALGAGLGAIGGIVLAPLATTSYSAGHMLGLKGFSAAVLGGLGNSGGAVIGGLVLGVLEGLGSGFTSGYKDLVAMVVLIVVLLIRPSGILGSSLIIKK